MREAKQRETGNQIVESDSTTPDSQGELNDIKPSTSEQASLDLAAMASKSTGSAVDASNVKVNDRLENKLFVKVVSANSYSSSTESDSDSEFEESEGAMSSKRINESKRNSEECMDVLDEKLLNSKKSPPNSV